MSAPPTLGIRLRRHRVGSFLLEQVYHRLRRGVIRLRYAGRRFHCPVCDSRVGAFLPFGLPPRPHAMCPVCESLERHRLYWLYYQRCTDLFAGSSRRRFLHFAPEMGLARRLRQVRSLQHITLDFVSPFVGIRADLCNLPLAHECAQIVHCSHVLEHVADDRAAMAELFRIMQPGSWGLIQVPVWSADATFEDPSIVTPADRERAYGQNDHVRLYGPDVIERLRGAGLQVNVIPASQFLSPDESLRFSIDPSEEIFHCERPAGTHDTSTRP